MPTDPANLNNLQDIVLPMPPSFWPPAQGFWILVALIVMSVITVAWIIVHRRQRNAYRRAGIVLLAQAQTGYEVNVVVKRVALATFPREQVAHLHGSEWTQFLRTTCPSKQFESFALAKNDTSASDSMRADAQQWIRHHQSNVN